MDIILDKLPTPSISRKTTTKIQTKMNKDKIKEKKVKHLDKLFETSFLDKYFNENKYILYMTDNMHGNARNNKGKLEMNKKAKPGKCIIPFKYNV